MEGIWKWVSKITSLLAGYVLYVWGGR